MAEQFTISVSLVGAFVLIIFVLSRYKEIFKNFKSTKKPFPPPLPMGILGLMRAAMKPSTNFAQIFGQMGQAGPIHSINFSWPKLRILIINDLDLGKELFQSPIFSDRPENDFWRYHAKGNYGIVTSSGRVHEEQRRYTLKKLKDAGVGNKSMETLIATEVEDFIDALRAKEGKVMSPNKMTSVPFFNTLWVLLTGERFKHGDNHFSGMLLSVYEGFMRIFELPQIFLLAFHQSPIGVKRLDQIRSWFPFIMPTLTIVGEGFNNLRTFCETLIHDRRQNLDRMDIPESFIDDYLREIESTTNENSTFYKEEGVMNLIATIGDLFIAAGETAANSLSWSMLHLIRNPKVQQKIQEELDNVVGRERRPTLSDRPNLPYTESFLWETLRMTPASIFSMPHVTTKDVDIGPYFIEKHSTVLLNIAAIHSEPKIWGDPQNFRCERFLSSDGKTFVRNDSMVAFSIGKRKCPAMRLGLDNLFLFVSAICQEFIMRPDPNLDELPILAPELSGLNAPKQFSMIIEDRNKTIKKLV